MANTKQLRTILQFRRDLAENFEAVKTTLILAAGEPAVIMDGEDKFKFKIGDGVNTWEALPYVNALGGSEQVEVDENTIVLTADGKLSLEGFDAATVGMIPSKGENGKLVWIIPTEVPDIEELKTKVDSLDETVNGKPAGSDPTTEPAVPGLVDKVADNTTAISTLTTNLNTNYYNKEEVDAKISASYKPGEPVDNITDLPSPPTTSDIGIIRPIRQDSVTTDDFIGGAGQPVPAGSQVVAIEKDGVIKYNIMPSNVDLSGYLKTEQLGSEFTAGTDGKIEISEIAQSKVTGLPEALASKLSGVSIDGTKLEATNGVVGLPLATAEKYGLVKINNTEFEIGADGTMGLKDISVDKLYVPEDSELVINGGNAAGN